MDDTIVKMNEVQPYSLTCINVTNFTIFNKCQVKGKASHIRI